MINDPEFNSEQAYTVQSGDSVGKICRQFYADSSYFQLLADFNKLESAASIFVGQTLKIPPLQALLALNSNTEHNYVPLTEELLIKAFNIDSSDESHVAAIQRFLPALNELCPRYGICGIRRQAHFLAQVAHESALFSATEENLNYSRDGLLRTFSNYVSEDDADTLARNPELIANKVYANRIGNGDEKSKDGWNFRGRGLIQLTGRANYQAFNLAYQSCSNNQQDLISQPDLVCMDPNAAVFSAVWFWTIKQLNHTADTKNVEVVTKIVNGGTHGLAERQSLFDSLYSTLDAV